MANFLPSRLRLMNLNEQVEIEPRQCGQLPVLRLDIPFQHPDTKYASSVNIPYCNLSIDGVENFTFD